MLVAPHGDARNPQVVNDASFVFVFKCTARTHYNLFILYLLHHERPLSYFTAGHFIYYPRNRSLLQSKSWCLINS